jgi:hypothetical protein
VNHSYATYPGVQNVLRASYTLSPGITPSVITMEIIPQTAAISTVGDVVFVHGTTTLTIRDCRADQASMVRGSDGTLVSFSLMDRRWRWKFTEIYGAYNQRDADGVIITATEKTPQQLAQLLLTALGESATGVTSIPNAARPEVDWVAANPAEALADLLEPFGLIVVLQIDGTVAIRQQGVGAALPAIPELLEQQVSSNPPEVPATIRVLGGPNRYQTRLPLEAVAYDTDGRCKPINDLSYKPAAGWGKETQFFASIPAGEARKLALRDVFRLYRITVDGLELPDTTASITNPFVPVGQTPTGPVGGMMAGVQNPPQQQPQNTLYAVQSIREILPLQKGLVQTGIDGDGVRRRKPEGVYGEYFLGNLSLEEPRNSRWIEGGQWAYPGRFQIDYELGHVRFEDQVTRWDFNREFTAAFLELECSFSVRNPSTNAWLRWSYTQPTNAANGYGVEVVQREELVWERYIPFVANFPSVWTEKTYQNELTTQSQYYANGRQSQYVTESGASGRYAGLQGINPDGAISQVTWEISGSGCYTSASRLYEPSPYVPPFKERRVNDMLRKQRRADRNQQRPRP